MAARSPFSPTLVIDGTALLNRHVGIGVYTYRLAKALCEQRPDFPFLTLVPAEFEDASGDLGNLNLLHLPAVRAPQNSFLRGIFQNAQAAQYALTHFPACAYHAPAPLLAFRRPRVTLVTLHDCLYRRFPRYYGRFGLRKIAFLVSEFMARKSSAVLTVSEFSKQDLVSLARIPPSKISVVYNWVPDDFKAQASLTDTVRLRNRYSLPDSYWVYLGGYDYRKNVEFLLESYAMACRLFQCPPLVLAGIIPPPNAAQTICAVESTISSQRLSSRQIIRPGFIASEDIPALLRAAGLLIYPSLGEGFGLPVLEAMAVETPVLVSNGSSLPEIVGNPDCRFDPLNRHALVEKLRVASSTADGFRVPVPEKFNESEMVRQYLAIIASLHAT